jgi:hypothetical protein
MPTRPETSQGTDQQRAALIQRWPELLSEHHQLEQNFVAHQEALYERDLPKAFEELATYRDLLLDHIREEEEQWLPLYASFGEAPKGGSAEILHDEHQKIIKRLDALQEWVMALDGLDQLRPRDMIEVFDRQSSFKHLMEHHDLRERRFFFPALEAWTKHQRPHPADLA